MTLLKRQTRPTSASNTSREILVAKGTAAEVKSTKSVFRQGDLLYGKLRPYLNKVWLADFDGLCSTDILVFPKSEAYDNRFLKYRFLTRDFVNYANSNSSGVNLPRVNLKALGRFEINLPPLPEQRRIVARIEELFSRLDAGAAALRHAKARLQRYRQSVLAAAVTGQLTQAWREQHPDTEPADELLAQILTDRRENWSGRGKYKPPIEPSGSEFTQLPDRWAETNVDSLIDGGVQNGLYLPKSKYGSGFPILRIDDFQIGWVRPLTELQLVNADENQIDTYSLAVGDLVINRVNSLTHLGKSALIRKHNSPALFESNMMRARISERVFRPFVELYLHSRIGRTLLTRNAKWAVNQASINQTDVCSTPLPLPPLAEQHQIVAEVESRTTAIDHLEAELDHQITRSNRLRQSTLATAFSGQL